MDVYLVRRTLPDVPAGAVRAAVQRLRTAADELAHEGHHVRYLGSAYVAADRFLGCVYQAGSVEVVRLATERAAVPYDDIASAVVLGVADRLAHLVEGELT